MKSKIFLLTLTLAAITAPVARAQLFDIDIRLGHRAPPPPPEVVVVVADTGPGGPEAWEHTSWNRQRRGYYYYPGGNAYYRPADRVWFYQDRGAWRSGRNLPEGFSVDFNRSVTLNMATERPYDFHRQVVARYPSNYFGTRVRLRSEEPRGRGNDNRGNDNHGRDDHGHDRDNGNGDRGHDRDNDHDGHDRDHDDRR